MRLLNLGVQDFLTMEIMFSVPFCVLYDEGRHQSQDRAKPLLLFGALGVLKMKDISQSTYLYVFFMLCVLIYGRNQGFQIHIKNLACNIGDDVMILSSSLW